MEYSTLSETLGCPVCHEISIPPIFQCQKGHIICKECLPQLDGEDRPMCPTCRTPLPQEHIRSLPAEQLAESLEVKCKNASHGCQALTKAVEIPQHLTNCQFSEEAWCLKMDSDSKCLEKYFLKDFPSHCKDYNAHKNFYFSIPQQGWKETFQMKSKLSGSPFFFELPNGNIYIVTSFRNNTTKMVTWKIFLRKGNGVQDPDKLKVPITVETSHCTVIWNLDMNMKMDLDSNENEVQGAEEESPVFLLLETFSLSLHTLFPPKYFKRPQSLKWNITFDFPKL